MITACQYCFYCISKMQKTASFYKARPFFNYCISQKQIFLAILCCPVSGDYIFVPLKNPFSSSSSSSASELTIRPSSLPFPLQACRQICPSPFGSLQGKAPARSEVDYYPSFHLFSHIFPSSIFLKPGCPLSSLLFDPKGHISQPLYSILFFWQIL